MQNTYRKAQILSTERYAQARNNNSDLLCQTPFVVAFLTIDEDHSCPGIDLAESDNWLN
jgi:hypothetical protein